MFNRYVPAAFAVTFPLLFVLMSFSWERKEDSVSDRVLAKVVGRGDRVCLQFDADYENISFECMSPYMDYDNDCDFKICAGAASCGSGKKYTDLYESTWLAVDRTSDEIGWRQKSSPCFGMIECFSSNYDPMKMCMGATLIQFPDGYIVNHASLGCVETIGDVAATGCALCSAGDPMPFHQSNQNWTWYEQVECNH